MADALPGLDESRGIIGDRHLIGVQTFDIARLTTHAVPVEPETFIAVSGVGPREDSNGSGKTSFLIAVSLLLADPQWRFESNGGLDASGILFKPDAAGVDRTHAVPAVPHGYVVGVFAEPGARAATTMTVWVRISTTAPYVQAKWVPGLHVADAATDAERTQQADLLWREMGTARQVSARRMSEELYGSAPRCLTYLDTDLRPAVPSLLSQQLTGMEPHTIGTSLIALSGMSHLLEQEEERRGEALKRTAEMEELSHKQERDAALDDATMAAVGARTASRFALQEGQEEWRRYLASSYLRAHTHGKKLTARLEELQGQLEQARLAESEARVALAALRAATGLADVAREARQKWLDAQEVLRQAEKRHTELSTQHGIVRGQRAELRPVADEWQGTPEAQAVTALEDARDAKSAAGQAARAAQSAVQDAVRHLADVERGRSGQAGEAIRVLEDSGIGAFGLLDQLDLDDGARALWEPRLSLWSDAVVVYASQAEAARRVLRCLPGALVIAADAEGAAPAAFEGVRTKLPLTRFLRTLDQRLVALSHPDSVQDCDLGLTVVGGFADPIAGRTVRLRLAQARVGRCKKAAEEAEIGVRLAQVSLDAAAREVHAAAAAARLDVLQKQADELKGQVVAADRDAALKSEAEVQLQQIWETAQGQVTTHAERVKRADLVTQAAGKTAREALTAVTAVERQHTELCIPAWKRLWEGNPEQAAALIASPTGGRPATPAQLRRKVDEHLRVAYERYALRGETLATAPEDLRRGEELRRILAEEDPAALPRIGFDDACAALRIRLDGHADSDQVAASRIAADRVMRERSMAKLAESVESSAATLHTLQDMIEQHLDGLFTQIDRAFNALDLQRRSPGAKLEWRSVRPEGARPWRWEVTPRWKRSPNSAHVSYRENANSAQVKVYAVQLVLAALLADPDTHGRVLILDELGNSLGENNRKDMLVSLREVADKQHITILGTCQDSVLSDAADVCGQLLWFIHASDSDVYNQPTTTWAFDPNGDQVEMTYGWIAAGRTNA